MTAWIAASKSSGACGISCKASVARAFQMKETRLDLGRVRLWLWNSQNAGDEKRPDREELEDLEIAGRPDRSDGSCHRPGDVANDIGDGPQPVHVGGRGLRNLWAPLHDDSDLALIAQSLLGGSNRAGAADGNRHHMPWKQDDVPNRYDDEPIRWQRRRRRGLASRALMRGARKVRLSHSIHLLSRA